MVNYIKTEELLEKISSQIWVCEAARRSTIRLAEHWAVCTSRFRKFFGTDFPAQIMLIQDDVCKIYFNESQTKVCLDNLLQSLLKSSFYEFYEKKALDQFNSFLSFCKTLSGQDLSKLSAKKLLALYDSFVDKEDDFTNFLWVIYILDLNLPRLLENELKSYLKKIKKENEYEKYLKIILSPYKKVATTDHEIDLLKLATKFNSINSFELKKEIDLLKIKYHFFNTLNFDEQPFDSEYYRAALNKILDSSVNPVEEISRIQNQFKTNEINFANLVNKFKQNKKLFVLVESCHKMTYYRDYRNDIRRQCYYHARDLYKEIARRLDVDLTNLLYLNRVEIRQSFIGGKVKVPQKEINSRKKLSAIVYLNKEPNFVYESSFVSKLIAMIDKEVSAKEFSGVPASVGKVTGIVKIIITPFKEGSKLNKDDILVTSMTNIDFVPLMSKASAIVTDEGGLLCHAAIVSRELKKPCVVGTKISTKVLKDGDLVEVDANSGKISVLKKA